VLLTIEVTEKNKDSQAKMCCWRTMETPAQANAKTFVEGEDMNDNVNTSMYVVRSIKCN
jgi:hypothetical protein